MANFGAEALAIVPICHEEGKPTNLTCGQNQLRLAVGGHKADIAKRGVNLTAVEIDRKPSVQFKLPGGMNASYPDTRVQ